MGLTAAVASTGEAVNVGDVASNHRYLSAFSTTKSEIILPIINDTDAKLSVRLMSKVKRISLLMPTSNLESKGMPP
jgi:hypothetical protein